MFWEGAGPSSRPPPPDRQASFDLNLEAGDGEAAASADPQSRYESCSWPPSSGLNRKNDSYSQPTFLGYSATRDFTFTFADRRCSISAKGRWSGDAARAGPTLPILRYIASDRVTRERHHRWSSFRGLAINGFADTVAPMINTMKRVKDVRRSLISFSLAALVILIWPATALAATDPGLASAGNFAVLSGAGMTNTGPSWITGLIGASGAGITGFPPGTAGTPQHAGDGTYTTAETDLTAAYGAAVQGCTADYSGVNLGGKTLGPGVYCQTTGATPSPTLTGTLTLNGPGIYIFLIGTTAAPTTLVTASGGAASVSLINGAQPCDVFWRVTSSATIGTSTAFIGTIMANTSIQMMTGATLWGRALARTAAVTLDTNRIIQPSGCTTGLTTNYPAPTAVAAPVPNTGNLPLSLGTIVTAVTPTPPNTGVPLELLGQSPWLLLIGIGGGLGAIALGVSRTRRRRRNT